MRMKRKKPPSGGRKLNREQTCIRIDSSLKELLETKGKELGLSFNSVVIYYLRLGLQSE